MYDFNIGDCYVSDNNEYTIYRVGFFTVYYRTKTDPHITQEMGILVFHNRIITGMYKKKDLEPALNLPEWW